MSDSSKVPFEQLMLDVAYEPLLILNEQMQILTFNESALQLLGETLKGGASLSDLMPSSELDSILRYVFENDEAEFEVQTKIDNRFFRVRTRFYQTSDSEKYIGVAFQDVSELVRLNRARRDMVANISHELRHPIANIRLIIDSLFHDAEKPKRKKSIQSIHDIARETDALMWLVQELLDLSMIESGQAIVKMVDVSLVSIVDETLEIMVEQAAHGQVELVAKIPDSINVLCDKDLIRRVLVNLLHNAMKYSPRNTKITISAEEADGIVTIIVFDRGAGVPESHTGRIFERFYQVDDARTGKEGTGLGLAICKHIVEAHGGQIWAEGVETAGGGKFLFTLLSADADYNNINDV